MVVGGKRGERESGGEQKKAHKSIYKRDKKNIAQKDSQLLALP